jgi:hypothetical protein
LKVAEWKTDVKEMRNTAARKSSFVCTVSAVVVVVVVVPRVRDFVVHSCLGIESRYLRQPFLLDALNSYAFLHRNLQPRSHIYFMVVMLASAIFQSSLLSLSKDLLGCLPVTTVFTVPSSFQTSVMIKYKTY